ncbi:MAG: LysM peptidoglycan-binding domain-containing protein [Spirochaetes bacterium]|nr:LysM peptidoglycan-binding domain-containing protein [Spirochaetota bacterium]
MRLILQRQKITRRKRPSRGRFKTRSPLESVFPRLLCLLHRIPLVAPAAALAIALSAGGGFLAWRLAVEGRVAPVAGALAAALPAGKTGQPAPPVDEPVGSGALAHSRDTDFVHVVDPGETLSEIAYLYHLDFSKLALYNNLPNPNAIHPGQRLLIPSIRNEETIKSATLPKSDRLSVVNQAEPGQRIRIVLDKQTDGRTVTAHFTLEPSQSGDYAQYEWDLGDGHKSFREGTFWTYDKPGTYTVSLKAWDDDGRLHLSNRIYLDVPHPGTWRSGDQRFVTLDDVGEPFEVDGEVIDVLGYPSVAESPIAAAGAENDLHSYSANAGGFFNLTVDRGGELSHLYLFVSPVPSRHADRADLDWYRTQFNTGTQSNCGPSMVSMALAWATGDYVPVAKVREAVGWQGDGGIGFEEMIVVLKSQGVTAWMQNVRGPEDLAAIIDSGRVAVLLYNTRSVRRASGDPTRNLFGAYYTDNVGHYVLVKGYSLDRKWLVVYDPIPSDWSANSVRYADGISMIGRNRYYAAAELFSTIRRPNVLVIDRPGSAAEVTALAADR